MISQQVLSRLGCVCGGAVASWLVCSSLERAVEPWPGMSCCVPGQYALLSQCFSSPRCINEYRLI